MFFYFSQMDLDVFKPYRHNYLRKPSSTLCGPSRKAGGIVLSDWVDAGGGESGYIAASPKNPDLVFAGSYGGLLTRKDMRTGLEWNVNPWPDNPKIGRAHV